MSEPKFTSGPWTTQNCSNGGRVVIRGQYGQHQQSHVQIVPEADAHLIAAAPELYEALEQIVLLADGCAVEAQEIYDAYDAARAALAKARGEA